MANNVPGIKDGEHIFIKEFSSVDFGDERLLSRLVSLSSQLASNPPAPINQACSTRKEVAGAYRFFHNPKVDPREMLDSHRLCLGDRTDLPARLFAVQDTVYFDFHKHAATKGLGSIGKGDAKKHMQGLIMHHSILVDANKVPYCIGAQDIWARPQVGSATRAEQKKRVARLPIEEKESVKWLSTMKETEEWVGGAVEEVIHLGDRECDIYEFLLLAQEKNHRYVVRNSFSRQTIDGVGVYDLIDSRKAGGFFELEVKGKNKIKRKAKLEVKFQEIYLQPSVRLPAAKSKLVDEYSAVKVWLVSVEELDPPNAKEKIFWRLFTNVPVTTYEQALERVKWYSLRWVIEDFHKILKSGCKVEDCRLADREALERFICLKSIVALRILALTFLSRKEPESPCTRILTTSQWKALYIFIHKNKNLPTEVPCLKQTALWIGRLGGHLGRKNDPPPGYTVLWRGWERLEDITTAWEIFNPPDQQRCV